MPGVRSERKLVTDPPFRCANHGGGAATYSLEEPDESLDVVQVAVQSALVVAVWLYW